MACAKRGFFPGGRSSQLKFPLVARMSWRGLSMSRAPEMHDQTRLEQGWEMLDAWSMPVPHGWVTGDDELGRHGVVARRCVSAASARCWECPAPPRA